MCIRFQAGRGFILCGPAFAGPFKPGSVEENGSFSGIKGLFRFRPALSKTR